MTLIAGQQPIGPLDRRRETTRLASIVERHRTFRQAFAYGPGAETRDPRRGELERERKPVQATADFGRNRDRLVVERDHRTKPPYPVGEQPHRRGVPHRGEPGLGTHHGQRVEREYVLRLDTQPVPARSDDPYPRASLHDRLDDSRHLLQPVLAVVEYEQQVRDREVVEQLAADRRRRAPQMKCLRDRRIDLPGVDGAELHEDRGTRQLIAQARERLRGEPGLPDASGARHRDEATRPGGRAQRLLLGVSADERGRGVQPPRCCGLATARTRKLVPEDSCLEITQRRRGIQPEIVRENRPIGAIPLQRLGRAAAAVQRGHQQLERVLAIWVVRHERLQLRRGFPVIARVDTQPLSPLDHVESAPIEPMRLDLRELRIGDVRVRCAAPQSERLVQLGGFRGRLIDRIGAQTLEPSGVDGAGGYVEPIAARVDADHVATE